MTFALQKSLAHTDYLSVYEKLRDKHLKNPHCSWLVIKRNEVLKEAPFPLEKQLILRIYLPMQHVELFNYESLTLKTVENLFSPSRR